MKEYTTCINNEQVIFNNLLRSARNQIECAFGRLKARWRILMRPLDVDIKLIPSLIHSCFILHNYCEMNSMPMPDGHIQTVLHQEKLDQHCDHHTTEDPTYTYTTDKGESVRETIKTFFSLH